MTQPAPKQPSLGMRCLRLLEALVWSGLAVVLPDWKDLATPLSLLFLSAMVSAPVARPLIDGVPRLITGSTSFALGVGVVGTHLASNLIDGALNRGVVVLALVIACWKARGFVLERRPRWMWIAAACTGCLALFALDHQRVVADKAGDLAHYSETLATLGPKMSAVSRAALEDTVSDLRRPDRFWWVPPALFAALLPLLRLLISHGLALVRSREAGRARRAWFRRPANLSD